MSKLSCETCGKKCANLSTLLTHFGEAHGGEIQTPDEYLGGTESEQKDFEGQEPDTSEHNPEYEVTNDPDYGEFTDLREFQRDGDDDNE